MTPMRFLRSTGHQNAVTDQNQAVGAVPFYLLRAGLPSEDGTPTRRLEASDLNHDGFVACSRTIPYRGFLAVLSSYSLSTWWTNEIAIEPSPTADATRLTFPPRTSPAANTPGRLVSSR
jgi:hypothetical protein